MATFSCRDQQYQVDSEGFLLDRKKWDEDFAEGMAPQLGIPNGLQPEHWKVIHFIRHFFEQNQECPLVYQTCRANNLRSRDFQRLFPTGYLRGACKLAGITYRDRVVNYYGEASAKTTPETPREEKAYRVDVHGFLLDPSEWDQDFAIHKAQELGMKGGLTQPHWKIIDYLRDSARKTGRVPTVFETCEANGIEIDDLEKLFSTGYHRGAVKIAGLLVRA